MSDTTNPAPKKSWRTTVAGVLTFLGSLLPAAAALIDGDPATVVDMSEVTSAIMGLLVCLGLMAARDSKVSSEDSRAK